MNSFLKQIAEHYLSKFPDNLYEFAFVFPNKRAGLYFRRELSLLIHKPLFSPSILTIGELLSRATNLQLEDKYGLLFRLYNIYNRLNPKAETFDEFLSFGEILLNDFDDIDKYNVDARQLYTNLKELKEIDKLDYLSEKQREAIFHFWNAALVENRDKKYKESFLSTWSILYDLYAEFRKELMSQNLAYEGMIFRNVSENMKLRKDVDFPYANIVFVGFNALTRSERDIFTCLKNRGIADFCWDYSSPMLRDKNNKASWYYRQNITDYPPAVEIAECTGFPEIETISTISDVGQTKQAQRLLEQLRQQHPISIETAVILADEKLLLPMLQSLPEDVHEINITMGFPLQQTPVIGLLNHILDLQRNMRISKEEVRFYHKNVVGIINHPYIRMRFEKDATTVYEQITKENIIYIPQSFLPKNDLFTLIFKDVSNKETLCGYLMDIIKRMQLDTQEKDERVLESEYLYRVYMVINRLNELLKKWNASLQQETLFRILRQLIENITIPYEGEPLSGLQIMGMLETRVLDFKNVIITSFNENTFPKKNVANTFIPYNLRKGFELPTGEHQDAVFAYHFYRLLSRAQHVFLIYNSETTGLKTGEISRYYYQLLYYYNKQISEKNVSYKVALQEKESIVIEKSDAVMKKLELFLIPEGKYLSPTSIKNYIECPLRFYFSKVEELKKEREITEDMESADFGTIFHAVMEKIYLPFKNKLISVTDIEKIVKDDDALKQLIEICFFESYLYKKQTSQSLEGKNVLLSEVIRRYVKETLRFDKKMIEEKKEPLFFIDAEREILETIKLPGGRSVNIGGKIDRIDKIENTVRIIDYKTGKAETEFKDIPELFNRERKNKSIGVLQTFIYALVLKKKNPEWKIHPYIYSLKDIFKTNFNPGVFSKQYQLEEHGFSSIEEEFEEFLTICLTEIFTKDVPFVQTDDEQNCLFCDFKIICNR